MGTKRGFGDVDSQPNMEGPSRSEEFDPKRRRQHGYGKHKAKEGSMEYSRKRARNIERLLKRKQDLPADVQNDLQRELAALKSTVSDKAFQKKRSAMISKYHMVRFFERKKAARLVKQLRRKLEEDPSSDEADDLKRQLHVAEVDEAYTIYHPHIEPYISLYGKGDADEEDDDGKPVPAAKAALSSERPPMWAVVEQTMEEGPEALNRLKERRTEEDTRASGSHPNRARKPNPTKHVQQTKAEPQHEQEQEHKPQPPTAASQGKPNDKEGQPPLNRRERRRLMREAMPAEESDDEGGFFEEA